MIAAALRHLYACEDAREAFQPHWTVIFEVCRLACLNVSLTRLRVVQFIVCLFQIKQVCAHDVEVAHYLAPLLVLSANEHNQ